MVPHLITALSGPINELEQRILDSMPAIERWFRLEWMEHTPPFYTSVDIRNAGFKLAPVDTNLYPGGWNNLTPEMLPLAVQAAMAAIEKICPEARNLLLIPENHTRNTFYLSNVAQLQRIFHMAGLNVRIGSINPEIKENTTIDLPNGDTSWKICTSNICCHPCTRAGACGARANTLSAMKKSPSALESYWVSTLGSSTPCSISVAKLTSLRAQAWSA